jgi:hypothetical protein
MDDKGEVVEGWAEPAAGDMVLLQIKGLVGKLVWLGQALNGDLSKWTHVGIMLDDGTLFEAQPGGAVMTDWDIYADRQFATVKLHQRARNRGPVPHGYIAVPLTLTWADRMNIVEEARLRVGRGYNWTTYFYLAAYRMGIRPEWLKRRVQRSDRLICSQAADEIYGNAGIHLFADGRMPYDVTPGDLARLT